MDQEHGIIPPGELGRRIKARLSELPRPRPSISQSYLPTEDRRGSLTSTPDILSRSAFEALLEQWSNQTMDGSEKSALRMGREFSAQNKQDMVSRKELQALLHRMAVAGLGRSEVFHRLSRLATMNRLGF